MPYLRYQRYHGILRFRYLPYRLDQVFSDVIPAIPTIPRYFDISVPYHTGSIRYFQQSCLRYQRYPGILRFRYLTIPARSGIFNSHTHDTHAYPGMEYLGYISGACRVRYLTDGSCEEHHNPRPLHIFRVEGGCFITSLTSFFLREKKR